MWTTYKKDPHLYLASYLTITFPFINPQRACMGEQVIVVSWFVCLSVYIQWISKVAV